eukprot:664326-Amphidinium_carterae.1
MVARGMSSSSSSVARTTVFKTKRANDAVTNFVTCQRPCRSTRWETFQFVNSVFVVLQTHRTWTAWEWAFVALVPAEAFPKSESWKWDGMWTSVPILS